MPRGGPRKGTPGKAYSNRTDLQANPAPQSAGNTAASGGLKPPPTTSPTPPSPISGVAAPPQPPQGSSPDDTPNLFDHGGDSPMTSGLDTGPGAPQNPNSLDTAPIVLKYLPFLQQATQHTGAPPNFIAFVRYLQGQQ